MKKVIDNKVYNTETAELIASYDNGLGSGDFHYISEELYRTKKGNYFLYGKGGALTRYAEGNGKQSWGSSEILDLSEDEAFNWLAKNDFPETIEEYFSDRLEEA
jgi:hypothetical protein